MDEKNHNGELDFDPEPIFIDEDEDDLLPSQRGERLGDELWLPLAMNYKLNLLLKTMKINIGMSFIAILVKRTKFVIQLSSASKL